MSGATEAAPRARLLCRTGELAGQTHPLTQSNLIGRNSENDVVLHSSLISGRHARIWEKDGSFFVEDLGSSNGTWVDGIRITDPVRLDRLNVITFAGAFDFVFSRAEPVDERRPAAEDGTSEATTLDLEQVRREGAHHTRLDMDFQPLPELEQEQEEESPEDEAGRTRMDMTGFGALPELESEKATRYRLEATFSDGRREVFDLETGSYTLGRSADSDITLDDPAVSRHHATLTVGETLVLEDADSVNGTLIDGSEVDRAELVPNSSFSLGPVVVEVKVLTR